MKHWVYPANPKYYDVIAAFTEEDKTAWPMNSKVEVGGFVYIYSGNPYKQILFKCQVVEVDLFVEEVMDQAQKYMKVQGMSSKKNFMLLRTVQQFQVNPDGGVSFGVLKENGLKGSIMGPQCLENNPMLFEYITSIEI